jgi:hypothetical protein
VSQLNSNGTEVSVSFTTPSTENSTRFRFFVGETEALTSTVPFSALPSPVIEIEIVAALASSTMMKEEAGETSQE